MPSAGIDPVTGNEIFIKRDGSYTMTYDANDKVILAIALHSVSVR